MNKVLLEKKDLDVERNRIKDKFVPKPGQYITFPNGVVYRVVFSNVGQLRFTAVFDKALSVIDEKEEG